MFGALKRWLFLKALSKIKKTKGHKTPLHLNPTHTISILYEISNEVDNKAVEQFVRQLKQGNKRVNTLSFQNHSLTLPEGTRDSYNKKNIPFNQVPKSEAVQNFLNTETDILIVLCHQFHNHLRYISYAHASFLKIGLHFPKGESYFDILVDMNPTKPYSEMIKNIIHFMDIFAQKK